MFDLPFHIESLPHQLYQFFIPQLPIQPLHPNYTRWRLCSVYMCLPLDSNRKSYPECNERQIFEIGSANTTK